MAGETTERFSLVVGGPFHALLRRLGLTGADDLPEPRAAIALAAVAWLPPALLAFAQARLDGQAPVAGFATDWTVHARYLVAIWVMVFTERYSDARIQILTRHFREAELLAPTDRIPFAAALQHADRRSSSAVAEALVLAAALGWSILVDRYIVELSGSSWEGTLVGDRLVHSWAGQASRFVSNPLFLFLVLRWIWRFGVWTALLYRISRLRLQLAPLHPDRAAGLGFLAIYPSVFSGFVFALSCVVASSFVKELAVEQHDAQTVWIALATWLAISLALFLGPLLVFVRPLYDARERALLAYGRLASQHHLAFQRRWLDEERSGADLMGSPDAASVSDLNAAVQQVWEVRLFPVDRAAVIQLLLAAGIPLLGVVVTLVPLLELAGWMVGTIL